MNVSVWGKQYLRNIKMKINYFLESGFDMYMHEEKYNMYLIVFVGWKNSALSVQ